MAQATNPKIEELRARIKTDPKSRLFFPLAEELRKMGGLDEAEQALRSGLEQHPTYLSAWVSLGRVLRERGNSDGVIQALTKALQLDPGNVVAARILADTYLDTGQKVEAIKKYKLVHALLPQDQDVEAVIEKLDAELNPPAPSPMPAAHENAPSELTDESTAQALEAVPETPRESERDVSWSAPVVFPGSDLSEKAAGMAPQAAAFEPDLPRVDDRPRYEEPSSPPEPVAGESALSRASQFDDTAPLGYDSHAFAIEQPAGMHIAGPEESSADDATLIGRGAGEASPWDLPAAPSPAAGESPSAPSSDVFGHASSAGHREPFAAPWDDQPSDADAGAALSPDTAGLPTAPTDDEWSLPAVTSHAETARTDAAAAPDFAADDVTNTITMGDLYARQGLVDDAREIYSRLLERDPGNESVRAKLDGLSRRVEPVSKSRGDAAAKAERLEAWLSRVKKGSKGV